MRLRAVRGPLPAHPGQPGHLRSGPPLPGGAGRLFLGRGAPAGG